MRGQKKRGRPHAVLLPIVEAWIDWTGQGDQLRKESGRLGREVNSWRREMQNERREMRKEEMEFERSKCRTLFDVTTINLAGKEEELVADYYATRMPSVTLLPSSIEDIHLAFEDSFVFDPTAASFQRISGQVNGGGAARPYFASIYSGNNAQVDQPAERHAQAYQALLGTLDDDVDEEHRGKTRSQEERLGG